MSLMAAGTGYETAKLCVSVWRLLTVLENKQNVIHMRVCVCVSACY
jgi:hypothetical protein